MSAWTRMTHAALSIVLLQSAATEPATAQRRMVVRAPALEARCAEEAEGRLAALDRESQRQFDITRSQRRIVERALTAAQQRTGRQIAQQIAQGRPFAAIRPAWEDLITELKRDDGTVDVNALVQWVLQDAYRETSADLRAYADRVRSFNQETQQVREYILSVREYLADAMRARGNGSQSMKRLPRITVRGYPRLRANPTKDDIESYIAELESRLQAACDDAKLTNIGDDAQLANIDLQNVLQRQQQAMQMMSNLSKTLHDTAMAIIRKIGREPTNGPPPA